MSILEKYRKQNPQYKDTEDKYLAKAMYDFYSKQDNSMSEDAFYEAIEYKPTFTDTLAKLKPFDKDISSKAEELAKTPKLENPFLKKYREKNPESKDLNDNELAKTMFEEYSKQDSSMSEDTFYDALGIEKDLDKAKVDVKEILETNKNIEKIKPPLIENLEHDDDFYKKFVSSLKLASNKTERGLAQASNLVFGTNIEVPKKLTQEEVDYTSGYSKKARENDNKQLQDIKESWDKGNYFDFFLKGLKNVPSLLADSSGEMIQLVTVPTALLAINGRVMDFRDEYIKNNAKEPDKDWYINAYATQTALLLAERFGLGRVGKMLLDKAPTVTKGALGVAGAGAFESMQEYGEHISEEYLTQLEKEKSLKDIASSDEAKFAAALGGVAGVGVGGAANISAKVIDEIKSKQKGQGNNDLLKNLKNEESSFNIDNNPLQEVENNISKNIKVEEKIDKNEKVEKEENKEEISKNIENSEAIQKIDEVIDSFENLKEKIADDNNKSVEELLNEDLKIQESKSEDININDEVSKEKNIQEDSTENIDNNIDSNKEIKEITEKNIQEDSTENIDNNIEIKENKKESSKKDIESNFDEDFKNNDTIKEKNITIKEKDNEYSKSRGVETRGDDVSGYVPNSSTGGQKGIQKTTKREQTGKLSEDESFNDDRGFTNSNEERTSTKRSKRDSKSESSNGRVEELIAKQEELDNQVFKDEIEEQKKSENLEDSINIEQEGIKSANLVSENLKEDEKEQDKSLENKTKKEELSNEIKEQEQDKNLQEVQEVRSKDLKEEIEKKEDKQEKEKEQENIKQSIEDVYTLNQDKLFASSEVARFEANLKAIKLIKENKPYYNKEEKEILSSYTGFGGLQKVFERDFSSNWYQRNNELRNILSKEEYERLERTTLSAYFTPLKTIKNMYDISKRLGFEGGQVLEPSVGTGRFLGMLPNTLKSKVKFKAVEIDSISYNIAKILYPNADVVNSGFEKTSYIKQFDMVIGNPPYGEFKLYDKNNKEYNTLSIHNYFVVKALDSLKESGILNFVISSSFLDNMDSKLAKLIGSKAKLIGAIRLPSNTFEKTGTKVTTDIVILQKLKEGEKSNIESFNEKAKIDNLAVNKYFVNNPQMIIGEIKKSFRSNEVVLDDKDSFNSKLQEAINQLPKNIIKTQNLEQSITDNENSSMVKGVIYIKDKKVFVNDKVGDSLEAREINMPLDKALKFLEIKKALLEVLDMQMDSKVKEEDLELARARLNNSYESFVDKYKALNHKDNRSNIIEDEKGYLVLSLEENYQSEIKPNNRWNKEPRIESFKKADILTKRTVRLNEEIKASNSKEALLFSLNNKGNIDLDYMQEISAKSKEELLKELRGEIFFDKDLGYVTRDVFLSGDVKTKYENTQDEYSKSELKKVFPKDLEAKDIRAEIGQSWIDVKYVKEFLEDKANFYDVKLANNSFNSSWSFEANNRNFPYKAEDVEDEKIVLSALNSKQIRIYYTGIDGKRYINQQATDYANSQVEKLKEDFEEWIFKDYERREYLVKKYNEEKNRFSAYPKNTLDKIVQNYKIPNIEEYVPRVHQKRAVYKAVFNNSPLLLNHTVGSGKSLSSQIIAMEWRRLNKARKPMIVTLKSVVPQYVKEFKEAYPNARILTPSEKDFESKNRKKFLNAIVTNDWDAVVITHDQLRMIENPKSLQEELLQKELEDLKANIEEIERAGKKGDRTTLRQFLKKKENLEARLESLADIYKDEEVISFDKLGVDGLIVDESHKFKKLTFTSNLGSIRGMPDQKGSKMAFDLFVKSQYLLRNTVNKNLVFMTGTPITNTIPELFLIQKFLQNDVLEKQGIQNFDSYAKEYVEQSSDIEISSTGKFKEVTRIKSFKNLSTLIQTTNQFIDTVTNEDIQKSNPDFVLPKLKNSKPTMVFLEPTKEQIQFNNKLVERVEKITKNSKDNHLTIFQDASKASIDLRLISNKYEDNKDTKVNAVVDSVLKKYKEFDKYKGTQLIFSDIGIPKSSKKKKGLEELIRKAEANDETAMKELEKYSDSEIDDILNGTSYSVYEDIKAKLIRNKVKAEEIAFIHDYETKEAKESLSKRVKEGSIRVVIGSTQKLGTGINVQDRLVAVHHIDIPFTPAELEQRNGRILRQGNKLIDEIDDFEIEIFYYATKRTLDAVKWQILENKSKFIKQFFDGIVDESLEVEELNNQELAAMMKAEASGNPLLMDKIKLEKQIKKLKNLKRGAELSKIAKKDRLVFLEQSIKSYKKDIEDYTKDVEDIKDKNIIINNKEYSKNKEIGEAIYDVVTNLVEKRITRTQELGSVGNMKLYISYNKYNDKVKIDFIGNSSTKLEYEYMGQTITGLGTKIKNKLENYSKDLEKYRIELANLEKEQEQLLNDKEGNDFTEDSKLKELEEQYNNILKQMSEKVKPTTEEIKEESREYGFNNFYNKDKENKIDNNPMLLEKDLSIQNSKEYFYLKDKKLKVPDRFNPMRSSSIRKEVIELIGNRLYFSKIKSKANGFYKATIGELRLKNINDIEILAHELAHYLDFYNGNKIFKNAYKSEEFKKEIESFSYTDNKELILIEGFAEYVRAYLTQYEFAKSKAPKFTNEFERIISLDKELEKKITKLQEDMHLFYMQGDEARVSAKIGENLPYTSWLKEIIFNIKYYLENRFIVNFLDRTHGFSVTEFALFSKHLKTKDSPTKLLRLALGGARGVYEAVIKYGTPKLNDNGELSFNGKGLADIFAPILEKKSKKNLEEFQDLMHYFAIVQAKKMQEQGKETPFTQSEIDTVLKKAEAKPLFKQIFNEYQEFNNRMLDFYVQMNYLRKEDVQNFKKVNQIYVPMQRVIESMNQKDGVSSNFIGGFYSRKGSFKNIKDIEQNITEQLLYHIKGALIARAKSKLFEHITNSEDGALIAVPLASDSKIVKVELEQQAQHFTNILIDSNLMINEKGQIVELNSAMSKDLILELSINYLKNNPEFIHFLSFGHKPKNTGSYIEKVIIDDKVKYFEIQNGYLGDTLQITLNNLGGLQYNRFLAILHSIKNGMTRLITAMPQFKIPNFVRDTLDAQVFNKAKGVVNPISGAKSYLEKDDYYKNYLLNGGGYGNLLEASNSTNARDIFYETFLQKADRFISFDEYSNRVGVAKKLIKDGDTMLDGAYEGRDLTVDFSISGANDIIRHIAKITPFLQAGINGTYKLVREIKDNGYDSKTYLKAAANLSVKGMLYLTSLSMIAFLINNYYNDDDERYKALTSDELARFVWIFYDKEKPPFKIPIPYALGFIFQKIPEYILSFAFSKDDVINNKYNDAIKFAVVNQLLPMPDGGIFNPIVQSVLNKKFTNAPIISPMLQEVEATRQYNNNTALVYRALGQTFGISPLKLEHFTKGYLGYAEFYIVEASQELLWDEEKWGARPYSSMKHFTQKTMFKQFYKASETGRSIYSQEYYKMREEILKANATFNNIKKALKIEGQENFKKFSEDEKSMRLKALKDAIKKVDKAMKNIRAKEEGITFNKNKSASQKEKELEELNRQKTEIFKEAYYSIRSNLKGGK